MFPDSLEIDEDIVRNYEPIYTLPVFSKVSESGMCNRVHNHLGFKGRLLKKTV